MNKFAVLRKNSLELQNLNYEDVVKVAGVVRQLKNWFKKQFDSEYRDAASKLQQETQELKHHVEILYKQFDMLQSAIRDGEVEQYRSVLDEIKKSMTIFWTQLKMSEKNAKDWYNLQQYEEPGFQEWFKTQLPKDYDIELNKQININFKDSNWYKNFTSNDLTINPGPAKVFFAKLISALVDRGFSSSDEAQTLVSSLDSDQALNALKQGIIDGTISSVEAKKPNKGHAKPQVGMTELIITTAPIVLNEKLSIQAKVIMIDLSTTRSSRKKLSLKAISHITPLGQPKLSSRKEVLLKAAQFVNNQSVQQLPYTITSLSEQDFAEIMRQGYRQAFGEDPTAEALAAGWAQAVLESGRPIKLPNNNVGNIKATAEWLKSNQPFFVKSTAEKTSTGKDFIDKDAKWRAYRTPVEGAAGYWKLLGNRYKSAFNWMKAGDPKSASVALAMNGYYTANIQKYSGAVGQLYQEFMTKIAPHMEGLISAPMAPPGEKPAIKSWIADYSKAEKESVLNHTSGQTELENVDNLINSLYATEWPLENLVKNAILKQILPQSKCLIIIKSNEDETIKLAYARTTAYVLRKFFKANVSIHGQRDAIEMQCLVQGSPTITAKVIQAVCDTVADGMSIKTNFTIEPIVVSGYDSQYELLDLEKINQNERVFQMKRLP